MLVELLSQSNYQSYNIKLANLFGLEAAVHLSLLIDINEKAYRKDKLKDGFFVVDRNYIRERTTLTKSKQQKIESDFNKVGILEIDGEYIKICLDTLTTLMLNENETLGKDLEKMRKSSSKSKGEYVLENVKKSIDKTLPYDLQLAYANWLDSVFLKLNFVNKQMLLNAQKEVDEASGRRLDDAIEIINIAAASGWKDMRWAVKVYKEHHVNQSKVVENKNINVDWSTEF